MAHKKINVRIGADNSELKAKTKESTGSLNNFAKEVVKVGSAIGVAFGAREVLRFGAELVNISAKAEGIRTAFNKLDNPTLLNDLRKATRGTVSDIELMQAAVRAKNFKIPLEQLAGFFKFATNRAIETGESVDYLVQSIIDGIGRKSSLVLDNLGISATELQEELKLTGDFGQAAGNIISESLRNAGDVADTTATKISRLKTDFQNWKEQAGRDITSVYDYLADWKNNIDWFEDDASLKTLQDMGVSLEVIASINPDIAQHSEEWKKVKSEIDKAEKFAKDYRKEISKEFNVNFKEVDLTLLRAQISTMGPLYDISVKIKRLEDEKLSASRERLGAINAELRLLETQREKLENYVKVEATSNEEKQIGIKLNEKLNNASGYLDTSDIEAEIDAMVALDDTIVKAADSIDIMDWGLQKVGESVASLAADIGGNLAQSLGMAIGAGESMGDVFADMGAMVASALGDILIMTGSMMGPAGIPLVLAGLGMKFAGGLIQGFSERSDNQSYDSGAGTGYYNKGSSFIYGNDIKASNEYYVDKYNRVG